MSAATPDLSRQFKCVSTSSAVAITAASVQSGTLALGSLYRLFNSGTSVCYFLQGSNPTATVAAGHPIPGGGYWPEPLHVENAEAARVAVISSVVSGSLYISRLES